MMITDPVVVCLGIGAVRPQSSSGDAAQGTTQGFALSPATIGDDDGGGHEAPRLTVCGGGSN